MTDAMRSQHSDTATSLSAIDERFKAIDRDYTDLRNMFGEFARDVKASVSNIQTKLDERSQTPWGTIMSGLSVIITIIVVVVGAFYWAINKDTSRLDAAMASVMERGVFAKTYDNDQARVAESLRLLRTEVSANVQQQRYNNDTARLTSILEELRTKAALKSETDAVQREHQRQIDGLSKNDEFMRSRSYDFHGRIANNETAIKNLSDRYDAISRRMADFIRDNSVLAVKTR